MNCLFVDVEYPRATPVGVENQTATPAGVEYPTSVAFFLKYANKLRFYTQKIRHEIGGVGLPRRILGSNVVVLPLIIYNDVNA